MSGEPATAPAVGAMTAALPPARLTAAALRAFEPRCSQARAVLIAETLAQDGAALVLTNPTRLAHFLAQTAHESAGFTQLEEKLSFSAERLMRVWPTRFPTLAAATPFARRPFALAERVYGGRMGNRGPGDGWRYRGRGLIQITGRETYAAMARLTGLPLEERPSLAAQPADAVRIALAFWRWKGCDGPADVDDLKAVTRRINGGLTGIEDRSRRLQAAKLMIARLTAAAGGPQPIGA